MDHEEMYNFLTFIKVNVICYNNIKTYIYMKTAENNENNRNSGFRNHVLIYNFISCINEFERDGRAKDIRIF